MAVKKIDYNMLDNPDIRLSLPQLTSASCSGALITSLLVTPFDVVKIRLQSQQKMMPSNKCFLYCNGLMEHLCPCNINGTPTPNQKLWIEKSSLHFNGTVDAFMKISRHEGITSLWSGLSPTLALALPATIIYLVSYENLRLRLKDKNNGVQPGWVPLLAGSLARTFSVITVSPLELIRTKMQSRKLKYSEINQAIKSLIQNQGVTGLFRGLNSTLLRDVPFSAIYWSSYETIKKNFGQNIYPSFGFSFVAGAASGSIAALVTTPFDVVKTLQQIELGEKVIYSANNTITKIESQGTVKIKLKEDKPSKGASMRSIMKNIYATNGIGGLFTGLAPRLIKIAPACAIMISSFEYGKLFFMRYNHSQLEKLNEK